MTTHKIAGFTLGLILAPLSCAQLAGAEELATTPHPTTFYVTADALNIRACNSLSTVLGLATFSSRVTILSHKNGNWVQVKIGNRMGCVSSKYLSTKRPIASSVRARTAPENAVVPTPPPLPPHLRSIADSGPVAVPPAPVLAVQPPPSPPRRPVEFSRTPITSTQSAPRVATTTAARRSTPSSTNKGEPIVVIGDSISCGPFGRALVTKLHAQTGAHVTLYCASSSTPSAWLGNAPPGNCQTMSSDQVNKKGEVSPTAQSTCPKTMKELIPTNSRVVIALGTNTIATKSKVSPDEDYQRLLNRVNRGTHNSCLWIGPPHACPAIAKANTPPGKKSWWAADSTTNIEQNIARFDLNLQNDLSGQCKFINSEEATAGRCDAHLTERDGLHPDNSNLASADPWLKKIAPSLTADLQTQSLQQMASEDAAR